MPLLRSTKRPGQCLVSSRCSEMDRGDGKAVRILSRTTSDLLSTPPTKFASEHSNERHGEACRARAEQFSGLVPGVHVTTEERADGSSLPGSQSRLPPVATSPGGGSETLHDLRFLLAEFPFATHHCRGGGHCLAAPRPVRQVSCPAASSISRVMTCGWEIIDRWLAFTSMVLAPMRLAMKRSRSGLIVRSSVETA